METRTVCPYCGVGCGLVLRTEGGRVVASRGEPGHPVSLGMLCPKGATAHEPVHHPDRLLRPMVRRDGELRPVSWDEAYGVVVRELARIRHDHGPDALAFISSARATVEENWLAQKFARVVLGTNNLDQCYRVCHSATVTGLDDALGAGAMSNSVPELGPGGPGAVLLAGSNVSSSHPIVWSVWMEKAVRAGTRLVVVDPRETGAAKAATLHLAARPGTEVALFHAMARTIVEEGWHDRAFLDARAEGFDAFWRAVEPWTPERAAPVCGVDARDIREAARLYATNAPASIVYGLGITEHRNGVDNVRALCNLAILTGNFGKPSSGINALRGQNDVQGATDMCRPETLPGYQRWTDPAVVARFESAWGARLPVPTGEPFLYCARMWEAALQGEVKGMCVFGSDPMLTEGNADKVERALRELEFLLLVEVYPSVTSQVAHVVLPACSYAEKDGTFVNTDRRVQRVRKAIEPVGESRADWRIIVELAQRMGHAWDVTHPEQVFEEIRRLVPAYAGITYARLDEGPLQWPCPDTSSPGTPILHVDRFPRGRARLAAVDPMGPAETPDETYPFLLTTGRTFFQYNSGTMTRRSRLEKGDPECHVEIGARDAARLGIAEGDLARVRTRRGELVVRARIVGIAEGVVWMPFHFAEAPANRLTNDVVDPECGITELKACAASLQRVGP